MEVVWKHSSDNRVLLSSLKPGEVFQLLHGYYDCDEKDVCLATKNVYHPMLGRQGVGLNTIYSWVRLKDGKQFNTEVGESDMYVVLLDYDLTVWEKTKEQSKENVKSCCGNAYC